MHEQTASSADAIASLAVKGGVAVSPQTIPIIKVDITDDDIEAAVAVLRSGMLAQGPRVAEFEERFAALTGARHAIACANGTCALQLAYELLIEPGDEVLCPAWTYIATASMLVARGAKPIFVDADPETYCIDLEDARRKITPRTTAIATTLIYGNPVDMEGVENLAVEHELSVIHDAAQAHLATFGGRGIGAFGDCATYSFYPTKNMTCGEGGMVTTNDDDLASRIRAFRSHGETEKYLHTSIGYNYRMTDVEGAMGASQLKRLANVTAQRRRNASRLTEMVSGIEGLVAPRTTPGGEHVFHLYAIRLDLDRFSCTRDEFIDALRAEGVACAVHYPRSLTRQPAFEAYVTEHLPVSDHLARALFCVPVHHALEGGQLDFVGAALAKVADAYRI